MKTTLTIVIGLLVGASAFAKPMTSAVESWEGTFVLRSPHIPIKTDGEPSLFMWLYQLDQGSKGTVVGFSNSDGDMIFTPHPQAKGVQPIYTGHSVFLVEAGIVEVVVTYDIQGNGGMKVAEKYVYDGKAIRLAAQSTFFGKTKPEWKRTDGEQQGGGYSSPAARSPKPTP